MRRASPLAASALLLASAGWSSVAYGQDEPQTPFVYPPVAAPTFELAAVASYLAPPIRGGATPFGAGFGGRLGVGFGRVVVGVAVVDYLGSTDVDLSRRSLLYGATIGFTIDAAHPGGLTFAVRPGIGAGGLTLFYTTPNAVTTTGSTSRAGTASTTSATVDVVSTASGGSSLSSSRSSSSSASVDTTTTVSAPYVEPALTLLLSSSSTFLAATASMLIVPGVTDDLGGSSTWLTYGVQLDLGLRF